MDIDSLKGDPDGCTRTVALYSYIEGLYSLLGGEEWSKYTCVIIARAAQLAFEKGAVLPMPAVRAGLETRLVWLDECPAPVYQSLELTANCSPWYAHDPLLRMLNGKDPEGADFPPPVAVVGGLGWTNYLAMVPSMAGVPNIGFYARDAELRDKSVYPTYLRVNPTQGNTMTVVVDMMMFLNYTRVDVLLCQHISAEMRGHLDTAAASGIAFFTLVYPTMPNIFFPPDTVFTSDDPTEVAGALFALARTNIHVSEGLGHGDLGNLVRSWASNAREMLDRNAHAHVQLLDHADTHCAHLDIMHYNSMQGLMGSGHCWLGVDPAETYLYDYDRWQADTLVEPGTPEPRGYLHMLQRELPVYHGFKSPYMYERPFDGFISYSTERINLAVAAKVLDFIDTLMPEKEANFGTQIGSVLPDSVSTDIPRSVYFPACQHVFDATWAALLGLNSVILKHGYDFQKAQLLEEIWKAKFDGLSGRVTFDQQTGDRVMQILVKQYRVPREYPTCTAPSVEACLAPVDLSSSTVDQYLECLRRFRTDASPAFLWQSTGGRLADCAMAHQQAQAQAWRCSTAGATAEEPLWGFNATWLFSRPLSVVCASHCAPEAFDGGRLPQARDDIFVYGRCTALHCRDSSMQYLQNLSGGAIGDCASLLAMAEGNCSADATRHMARLQPGSTVSDVCGASCPCRPVPAKIEAVTVGHFATQLHLTAPLVFYNGTTDVPPDRDLVCPAGQKYLRVSGVCSDCPPGRFSGKAGQTACGLCPAGTSSSTSSSSACDTCNVGKFSRALGSTTCSECEPGQFGDEIQASECKACGQGHYSAAGAIVCIECPAGKYSDVEGSEICTSCPPRMTSSAASVSVDQCLCSQGMYKGGTGSALCISCPSPEMTTPPVALFEADCNCGEGTFKDVAPNNYTCSPCPKHMACGSGSDMSYYFHIRRTGARAGPGDPVAAKTFPLLLPQYWSDPRDPLSVFSCAHLEACPGGVPGECSGHFLGRSCAKCPGGFGLDSRGTDCVECTGFTRSGFLFPTLVPILLAPAVVIPMYVLFRDMPAAWDSWQNGVSCLLFLVLGHYQVLALILSVPLQSQSAVYAGLGQLKAVHDIVSLLRIDCAGYESVLEQMLARAVLPIGLLLMTISTYLVTRLSGLCCSGYGMDADRLFNVYMSLFCTFFNGIAHLSMMLFKCVDNPNLRKTLHADRSLLCYEGEWLTLLGLAIPSVLLYCVLSLAVFAFVMQRAPSQFGSTSFQKRWKFLFIKYRPDIYYWSGVYLLRGVVLNAGTAILSDGLLQLAWLLHTLGFYLWLIVFFRPWRRSLVNHFDMICHLVHLSCIFFVGLSTEPTTVSYLELLVMTISVSLLPIPLLVAVVLMVFLHKKRRLKQWAKQSEMDEAMVAHSFKEMAKFSDADVHLLLRHATDYDKVCLLHAAIVVHSETGTPVVHKASGASSSFSGRLALSRSQRDGFRSRLAGPVAWANALRQRITSADTRSSRPSIDSWVIPSNRGVLRREVAEGPPAPVCQQPGRERDPLEAVEGEEQEAVAEEREAAACLCGDPRDVAPCGDDADVAPCGDPRDGEPPSVAEERHPSEDQTPIASEARHPANVGRAHDGGHRFTL